MDQVMGVVVAFAGAYLPRYWATCDGQAISISANQALFSLLGITYGGNGTSTFNLPDLRGRTAIAPGSSAFGGFSLGQAAGVESVTLTMEQIITHNHSGTISLQLGANSAPGIDPTVNDGYPSEYTAAYSDQAGGLMYAPGYSDVAIGNAGSGLPVDTRSPFLVIQHIICLSGIFPSRG